MASKAWYLSAHPRLIRKFDAGDARNRRCIEVWTTTCIVTNFGLSTENESDSPHDDDESTRQRPRCSILLNPANPNLTGPNSFPYFPRGGPQPPAQPNRHAHHIMGYVSMWGGMDVGGGMLFSAETIDGLVHQIGGLRLRAECSILPAHHCSNAYVNQQSTEEELRSDGTVSYTLHGGDAAAKCPVGVAVMTSPGGEELRRHYDSIIHTTPPFYKHPPWETRELKEVLGIRNENVTYGRGSWSRELLRSCYRQSFRLAFDGNSYLNGNDGGLYRNAMAMLGLGESSSTQLSEKRLAVPLLGAGCRDFPKDVAIEVAASESAAWIMSNSCPESGQTDTNEGSSVVCFGLLEETDAEALSEGIDELI